MIERIFRHVIIWLFLSPGVVLLSCSAGVGGGGLGGVGPNSQNLGISNAVGGGDSNLGDQANVNVPPVAGGEGHGQEGRKVRTITVSMKDGPSNCGILQSEAQAIFPEGEDSPSLSMSFSKSETPPFYNPEFFSMGADGRITFPECPKVIRPRTENILLNPTVVFFTRLVVSYTDADGKAWQSEPKVAPCEAECTSPPCDICLTLVELSSLDEADQEKTEPPIGNVVGPPGLQPFERLHPLDPSLKTRVTVPKITGPIPFQKP